MDPTFIAQGLIQFLLLLFSLSVHECAHAAAAYWLGDDTASLQGRLTLNPASHIDPIGTLVLPLVGMVTGAPVIGWAKPVPTNPSRFKWWGWGQILVAGAGPLSNLILAVFFLIGWAIYRHLILGATGSIQALEMLLFYGILLNILLAAFNLLPLTPLDGSWIASYGLPRRAAQWYDTYIAPYGFIILIALLVTGLLRFWLAPFLKGSIWLIEAIG